MRIGKFKLGHYINYIVIGLITVILTAVTLAGGHFDSSLLFLLEKIAVKGMITENGERILTIHSILFCILKKEVCQFFRCCAYRLPFRRKDFFIGTI